MIWDSRLQQRNLEYLRHLCQKTILRTQYQALLIELVLGVHWVGADYFSQHDAATRCVHSYLSWNTIKLSAKVQVLWSRWETAVSIVWASFAILSNPSASGGALVFHISSMLRNLLISSLKTLSKTRRGNSSERIEFRICFSACDSWRRVSISLAVME